MTKRFDLDSVLENMGKLPREKDILTLDKGLNIVVHEFLDDITSHKGTVCDIKDLANQTIYRVRCIGEEYTIEVIIPSPKSTMLPEVASSLEEAVTLIIKAMNSK